MRNTF